MEKEISNSEIVGNLRKAVRLFKAFEKAGDMAEMFCDYEAKIAKLSSEIDSLSKEKENLDSVCEKVATDISSAKDSLKNIEGSNKDLTASAEKEANGIISKAKAEALSIIDKANGEVTKIKATIKTYKTAETKAGNAKVTAESELASVRQEIVSIKAAFAQS